MNSLPERFRHSPDLGGVRGGAVSVDPEVCKALVAMLRFGVVTTETAPGDEIGAITNTRSLLDHADLRGPAAHARAGSRMSSTESRLTSPDRVVQAID